jgi:hypothetical protein
MPLSLSEGEDGVYNLSTFPNTLVPTANGIFYLTSTGVLVANGPYTSGAVSGGGTDGSVLYFATAAEQEFGLVLYLWFAVLVLWGWSLVRTELTMDSTIGHFVFQ